MPNLVTSTATASNAGEISIFSTYPGEGIPMFSSNQPRSSANMTNVLAGSIGCGAVIGLALMSLTHAAHANGAKAEPQIPVCDHTLGTLAIQEPQNQWWIQLNLDSPEALIKVIVSQSHCFK